MEKSEDVEALVESLIKKNNLASLMDEESKLYRQIRMLNSEFHTLLYENYNKLISAAQIIGQMSSNFDHIEQDISSLSNNMDKIIKQSDHLSSSLSEKFKKLSTLSQKHSSLKQLEFTVGLEELVLASGQSLSKMLMESIEDEDWITDQKPRHVRPVVIKAIENLGAISDNLEQYCEDGPPVDLKGQLSRIIEILLRTIVECVRLETFNTNGTQQLQIDANYLRHELRKFVSDESFVLLDEAVNSAKMRCVGSLDE